MNHLKNMRDEYKSAIDGASAMAFIHVLHRNKSATFGDVAKLAKELGVEGLTIGQCFGDDLPASGKGWTERLGHQAALPPQGGTVSTRTKKDRLEFDTRILRFLESDDRWISSNEIRKELGGTPDQMRKSVNRLIELGQVKYKGKARGTRYKAA